MLPEPLHPAIVHFPMALVVLLPLAALAALIMIRRGAAPRAAWIWVVVLSAALAGSSWLAVETGENQEEAVEEVVGDQAIHGHEEAAELFLPLTAVAVLLFGAGLARGRVGLVGRYAALATTVVLLFAGYRVGHSGGELVYTHGAARAYTGADGSGAPRSAVAGDRSGTDRRAEGPERDDEDGADDR